MIFGSKKDD